MNFFRLSRSTHSTHEDCSVFSLVSLLLWMVLCVGTIEGIVNSAYSRFLDLDLLWAVIVVDLGVMLVLIVCAVAASFVVGAWRSAMAAWFVFCVALVIAWLRIGLPGVSRPVVMLLSLSVGISSTRWVCAKRSALLGYSKRTLPWIILGVVVLGAGVRSYEYLQEARVLRSLPHVDGARPNILLIVVDTLRADHMSTYGYKRDTSPNLSRIAERGVIFDNAIAPASWTLPSHASMLTGLYPHDHHTDKDDDVLAQKWPTVGEVLLSKGYRTAGFSANILNFSRSCGLGRGFAHFEDYYGAKPTTLFSRVSLGRRLQLWMRRFGRRGNFIGRQRAAEINNRALAWIGSNKRPFFIMLNYIDAHDPYKPPEPFLHAFTQQKDPGGKISLIFDQVVTSLDAESLAGEVAAYDGSIQYVDTQIQDLMNSLRKRGILDNTIVVITSDHGEAFGEHNLLSHKNGLYREVIHVPLIVWNPKAIPAGRHVSRPISLVDIPRTLIAFADPDYHGSFPGRSLEELWAGDGSANRWPDPLSELAQIPFSPNFPNYYAPVRSVVGPEYQYISQKGGDLLYDWKADPQELHDLSHSEPSICTTMRAEVDRALPMALLKQPVK